MPFQNHLHTLPRCSHHFKVIVVVYIYIYTHYRDFTNLKTRLKTCHLRNSTLKREWKGRAIVFNSYITLGQKILNSDYPCLAYKNCKKGRDYERD